MFFFHQCTCFHLCFILFSATTFRKGGIPSQPFATSDEFRDVYPQCMELALQSVTQDERLHMAESVHGPQMLQSAKIMMTRYDELDFMLPHLEGVFVSDAKHISLSQHREHQRARLHQLRCNMSVRQEFTSVLTAAAGVAIAQGHMFYTMLLRHFVDAFLKLQMESIANKENVRPTVQLDSEDRDILAYICGYIIRRIQSKTSSYHDGLLEVLGSQTPAQDVPVQWITACDRGGLLYPSTNFFLFMEECEAYLRSTMNSGSVNSDSLLRDQLKEDLLENVKLQQRWDSLGGPADTFMEEKVLDLYLTIRGHATAKHVMAKYRSAVESSRRSKSLRKSLKEQLKDM